MRIEHIALYVNDLDTAKEFFEKYFDAKTNAPRYENKRSGFASYFLSFDGGARIELMSQKSVTAKNRGLHMGYNHIAISVGSREKVNELTARLSSDGYEILSDPRTTGDGYYESCVVGIESNLIEITV